MEQASDLPHGTVLCVMTRLLGDSVRILPSLRGLAKMHGKPVHMLVKRPVQVELYSGVEYIERVYLMRHWKLPFFFPPAKYKSVSQSAKMPIPACTCS